MSLNAIQSALLLGVRLVPASYRYNDSEYCKVEGATLIVINLMNMWIVFLLSLESCLMIRFDLNSNKSAARGSIKDLIIHKTNRFRTYCTFILVAVILNTVSIWLRYGFGSRKHEPILCSFKFPSSGWDEAGWLYHWVTWATTFGILFLAIYTVAFIRSKSFAKHRLNLKISGLKLFSKLICLPLIFMVINFSFLYKMLVKTCRLPFTESIGNLGAYFGHAMGGLLAIGIWSTNSFVRRQLNKKTFRLICHYCKCKCAWYTIRQSAEVAEDKLGDEFQSSGSQNDLKRSLLSADAADNMSLDRDDSSSSICPDYVAYVYEDKYTGKMATRSNLECVKRVNVMEERKSQLV